MKNIIIKSITILVIAFSFTNCNEEFLEKKPIAQETEETFYNSFERLDYTATAAYGNFVMRDMDYFYYIPFQASCDDIETGGQNLSDWPEWQNIDRLSHTPNESRVLNEPYSYWYKGIRMTNEFLERVDDVLEIDPTADIDVVNHRIAEMKFMRAMYHFLLMQVYGGVPIADKTIDPTQFSLPRSTVAEVLHFIQEDLSEAIPVLKEKSQLAPDYGRATKGAARSLLAKAYLYESSYAENYPEDERFGDCEVKYDLALQYAEDVINSDEYELVGINGERFDSWRDTANGVGGFRYIFTTDGDNCGEAVFEAQNVADGRDWTWTRGSYMTIYTSARRIYEGLPGSDEVASDQGWSFNIPSQYLVAAFGNQDRRETGLNSSEVNPILDPRFSTTIGCGDTLIVNENIYTKPWDTILFSDGSEYGKWYYISFSNIPAGTIHRKYECSPQEFWDIAIGSRDNQGPLNVKYIRYADVVLMAAEAAYKTGDMTKALNYVNQVRERARMSSDTGYPLPLSAISFEDIIHERRLELACEPARFPDLVRWGIAEEFIDGIYLATLGDGFPLDFVPGKHEFMPIATSEIQLNEALEQYDAWK